ncbi:MAG: hypothetical protein P4M12_04885 [Gammaproteobacteria bacterium]|nr:hypothetical protein [Gammaproteobacteria bacterium]
MQSRFDNVLKELVIRHREHFETKMALTLIEDQECINAVVKISNKVIEIFEQYPAEIKEIIDKQPKVLTDLYSIDIYGHLTRKANVSPYDDMLHALKHAHEHPTQALHVQMCFIYRIYDHLDLAKVNVALKQEWVEKIYHSDLFSDRARKEISSTTKDCYKQGICHLAFFNAKIASVSSHKPAKEKFKVDENSNFYKSTLALSLPTVCGPSGHTGSLVLLAGVMNTLDKNEWQDYALIVASFLVIAGCHSFHESMMVSKTAGVKYEYGDYQSMFFHKLQSPKIEEILLQHNHLVRYK